MGSEVGKCKRLSAAIWQHRLDGVCLARGKQTVDNREHFHDKKLLGVQAQYGFIDLNSLTSLV